MIEDALLQKPLPVHKALSETTLWVRTLIFSFVTLFVMVLYIAWIEQEFTRHVISGAAADTAFILIGLSFALSSICYFWNFVDTKIVYRKHLGLAGFAFALTHGVIALWFAPDFPFPSFYLSDVTLLSFVFALSALFIYAVMAIISNRYAVHVLGGRLWRWLLRVGYLAYVYTIFHFSLRGYPDWIAWVRLWQEPSLPPSSLLMFLFGMGVIMLRIAMEVSHLLKPKSTLES